MTAVLETPALSALTDDQLADAWSAADVDDPAVFAAFTAEFDRRTRAERMARARARLGEIRDEGWSAAYAQYLDAEAWTRGRLFSRKGMQAAVTDMDLWTLPLDQAEPLMSEELRDYFMFVAARITPAAYVRQRAAETRRARAEALDSKGDDSEHDGSTELAGNEARSLRRDETAAEAPEAGPGRAMDRSRPGRPVLGEPEAGSEEPGTDGGTGQSVPPGRVGGNGGGMDDNGSNSPVPGAEPALSEACILDEVADFVADYIAAPQSQRDAMVLYAAATHALHAFPTFGRMLFSSEEEASGKTMAMMITAALSANPLDASGTPYALTSALAAAGNTPEQPAPTLFYDEISSLFGRSGLAASRNPIADILRKGYKSGATSQWSVNRVNEKFSVYTPFLMTGLRVAVPRDIRSRSVCILMEPGTPRRYFDAREAEPYACELAASLARTVRTCVPDIAAFRARGIHPKLKDRRLEIWEPLCAVAYILGGQRWLNRCVSAFKDLALAESDEIAITPRQQTIKDVAAIAASSPRVTVLDGGTEFVGGLVIVDELRRLGNPRYQGRTEAGLALLVSDALPMNTVQLRIDGERVRGYYVADIEAAWDKIRPDEPEDVEIPEEVNPFEVDGDDETAGRHDVTAGTAVTGSFARIAR